MVGFFQIRRRWWFEDAMVKGGFVALGLDEGDLRGFGCCS